MQHTEKQSRHSLHARLLPGDDVETFSYLGPTTLGFLQLLLGALSTAFGIGAICTKASGYFIGYGIWCGFMVSLRHS